MTKAERDKLREMANNAEPGELCIIAPSQLLALLDMIPEWRPMESAPKDGTRVLLLTELVDVGATFRRRCIGHYCVTHATWHFETGIRNFVGSPTHWMPLPEVPNE